VDAVEQVPFGTLLRRFRLAVGITQATLAGRAGLSERAVNDLERDLKRLPRLATVTLLADALQLSPDQRAELLAAARPETRIKTRMSDGARSVPSRVPDRAEHVEQTVDALPALPHVYPSTPPPMGGRLPAAPGPFIGRVRVRDVDAVCERLRQPGVRLLTLTGPGASARRAWRCRWPPSSTGHTRTVLDSSRWRRWSIPH
jgi:transcriptional regulator with XRE-family HTH domain